MFLHARFMMQASAVTSEQDSLFWETVEKSWQDLASGMKQEGETGGREGQGTKDSKISHI